MRPLLILRILAALASLYGLIKQTLAVKHKAKRERWEAEGSKVITEVKGAKTDEDRARLAKSISDHLSHMP